MAEERLFHAYMLTAPEGPAREQAARTLAARLLCGEPDPPCGRCRSCRQALSGVHPDVTVVKRGEGEKGPRQEILVDQIRALTADAALAPSVGERKVYIIDPADRMNSRAQDALLKTLEDPPGHACFILCAASADALLPTVRSRCIRTGESAGQQEDGQALSGLAAGYLEAAVGDAADVLMFCMNRMKLSQEDTVNFVAEVKAALCDILCGRRADPGLGRERILRLSGLMDEAEGCLRRNVAPKQIFGLLAVRTPRE